MNKYLLLSLLISAFLFTGCTSPKPLSILEADEPTQKFWHQGQEFVVASANGITIETAYNREVGEYYAFDFAIYNESDIELLVDPSGFYYLSIEDGDSTKLTAAENPEEQLLEIDKELSRIEAEEINHSIRSALAATVELTAVVASELSNENEHERRELRASIRHNWHERNLEKAEIEYDQLSTLEQRDFWKTQTLRKTTLFPDQYITGQIFFSKDLEAEKIILNMPVENELFEIKYHQRLIKVDK